MILIIDNYDSFTYNLVQYIGAINQNIKIIKNDELTIEEIQSMDISHIVISPGPGNPHNTGICKNLINTISYKQSRVRRFCNLILDTDNLPLSP